MKRFLLQNAPDRDGSVLVRGEDYHYLVHVRRLKSGGAFDVLLPGGEPARVTVRSITDHVLEGVIAPGGPQTAAASGPRTGSAETSLPPLYIFQALPKGTKMDLIVRQAAEGGVGEVVPFTGERSVPVPQGPGTNPPREERWRRIIREARQQSGSRIDTRIHPLLSEEELLAYWEQLRLKENSALGLLFHESPPQTEPRSVSGPGPLEKGGFHRYLSKKPALVALAVGPEGGFSPAECKRFIDAGFKVVRLGDTVLRTETAALYGTAAVRMILLERPWWTLK
ncbi:MAG: RsmE family RNA methyltransferase [Treponema sp.]|nr:RsmE family RNA methyltransferase [Treponema sp.]